MMERNISCVLFEPNSSDDYTPVFADVNGYAMSVVSSRRRPANMRPPMLPLDAGAAPSSLAERPRLLSSSWSMCPAPRKWPPALLSSTPSSPCSPHAAFRSTAPPSPPCSPRPPLPTRMGPCCSSMWCSSCSARPALACRSAGAVNPLSAPAPQLRDLLLRRRRCRPEPCPHASLPRPSSAASSHTSAARPAAEPSFCGLSEGRPLVPTRSCCVMQSSLPHKAPASLRTRAFSIPHSTCPSPSARALLCLQRR